MMKKPITLALLAIAGVLPAMAAPVSQQRAGDIALTYVAQQQGASASLKVASIDKINDGVYLVNFSPVGFAMVSADDNATPILGYSTESNLNTRNLPENMAFVMKEAGDIVKMQGLRGELNNTWKTIENGSFVKSRALGEPVEPLIKVNWNQPAPFNTYCPGDGANKAIVGCVAVAMSQAMSVQKYPARPQGQVEYMATYYGFLKIDFDKEDPYDWDAILSGADRYKETARLLYHAGMSVEMGYGPDGSGIPSNQVYRITNALKNHFSYGSDVEYFWRKDYRGDWAELLLNELYAGRAIVYNAVDSKGGYGHSFNVDGYNGAMFHVNWGWGGTGNGYFNIDALQDAAMGMNYDTSHVAVIGIGGNNSPIHSLNMPDRVIEANQPAGTIVSALLINGELPTDEFKVDVTGEYYNGGYREVPFRYENGKIVTTRPLTVDEGQIFVRVVASLKADPTVSLIQGFQVSVENPQPIQNRTSVEYDRASKMFTVHTKYTAAYTLKNPQGAVILTGTVGTLPEFQFSRDQLANGTNVLEITVDGSTYSVNIVK